MNESQKEIPDYEVAQKEAEELFNALGIAATCSDPQPGTEQRKGSEPWHHLFFVLSFVRGAVAISAEWRAGLGLPKWERATDAQIRGAFGWSSLSDDLTGKRPGGQVLRMAGRTAEGRAGLAKLAKLLGYAPAPWEVLTGVCRDGQALYQTFEDWAADYGYDSDSREAERVYNGCCEAGRKALRLVGRENMDKFAELAGRF